jgi:hypothetical protein
MDMGTSVHDKIDTEDRKENFWWKDKESIMDRG